jgi:hypothetical protein
VSIQQLALVIAMTAPAEADASGSAVEVPAVAPRSEAHAVPDAAWSAVEGKRIVVTTADGEVAGELAGHEGETLVLIAEDGAVRTLPKADATAVRVQKPPASARAMPPAQPRAAKADDAAKDEADDDDDDEPGDKAGKKKRDHALLGAFMAHGAAYTHWRGRGVSAGHAAYAMDLGVGINPTPGFGMYAMGGGLLGAKIENKTIKANYGHIAFMFAFGGKYYFSMIGAGVAFNRLAFPGDTQTQTPAETQKDIGLALPMKLFGRLPLPHDLYLGIGLSYELGIVRDFNRFVNGIGGQIVFGRW